MSANVVVELEKSPSIKAEELYSFIRKNGFISSNSLFVDTEDFKKGKDNHLLYVDHNIVGVIGSRKSRSFFNISKRPLIGIIYLKEKTWTFKVFGEENYKGMSELADSISEHFNVAISLLLKPNRPYPEEYVGDIWRSSSYVGRV